MTFQKSCDILRIISIIGIISEKGVNLAKSRLPLILEVVEAQKLLAQPNKRYPTGLRNKAIISLILHCGPRLSEVINIKPGDINLGTAKLRIKSGKGQKDRDLAIPDYLIALLESWRKIRPKGAYFFSTLSGNKLSPRYIQQMLNRYAQKAGIEKPVSPHLLRHTYATQYYRQTKDIETLRRILGHADISTTTIYITLANIDVETGMKNFKGFL